MFPLKSISYIAYCVDCGRKGAFCTFAGSDSIPFAGKIVPSGDRDALPDC